MNFPVISGNPRVALAHDWLTGMRGGERVLELFCRWFPTAPLLTLLRNPKSVTDTINAHPVQTSFLQHVPGIIEHYRLFLPLFPAAVRHLKPADCDLLLSTSHCAAKSVRCNTGARHVCYCFTPMRYAWLFYEEYFGPSRAKALAAKPLLAALRRWDRNTACRVHRFVAISEHVRKRLRTFYGRDADVVYPPVDTEKWTPGPPNARDDYDLLVSALVPYKRVDLAVRAYTRSGMPLRIVGVGGELERLRRTAGPNITFLEWQPDDALLSLYRSCRLLVFPGEEDFGIVPLEAQACGRPVVAFGRGGALETIRENVSGVFFSEQTEEALLGAVETCANRAWDPDAIREHAETFSIPAFLEGMAAALERCLSST